MLKIENGKIISKGTEIKELAIILDIEGGIISFGEKKDLFQQFSNISERYRNYNFIKALKDLAFVNLTHLKLTPEEQVKLVNYMWEHSANGKLLMDIIHSNYEDMKRKINDLQ